MALIAGPTASGKSALALEIARAHRGVVINADSAQVYADLRVLSARPSEAELAAVPHALYGHVDGAEEYSAARWAVEARAQIADAHAAGLLPVVAGGTGLYLRTLIDGIAPVPEIDPAVRAAVRAMPTAQAHAALAQEDPQAAARLNAGDTTRVARALEVVRSSGRTLTSWQRARQGGIGDTVRLLPMILLPDREWLFERCDRRVEAMIEGGAAEEVEALLARGDVAASASVRRAIGVAEIADWLSGNSTREQAVAAMQLATRQYAKRQYTWFRNQPPADWRRVTESQNADLMAILAIILRD
ncbi:tRNA (adenosine(37)-N6)-dimethylallyltransferase MiaA [soil metagenome]